MLFRIAGKLSDNRPLSTRIEAASATEALGSALSSIGKVELPAGVFVREISCKPMESSSEFYIGEPKAARVKKTPDAAAVAGKPAAAKK